MELENVKQSMLVTEEKGFHAFPHMWGMMA